MVCSSPSALSHSSFTISSTNLNVWEKPGNLHSRVQVKSCKRPTTVVVCSGSSSPAPTSRRRVLLQSSVSLAASAAILLCSNPEENQKKYAENDARFRSTQILKELLEKSKLNKEKNSKEIQDKYCIRGAEWGVGDCSAEGMTPNEKDKFIAMLKEKAGVKD
nr:uncharacterized protein LOC103416498 isoform X2 [Malus domestica]